MGNTSRALQHGTLRDPLGWVQVLGLAALAVVVAELIGPVTAVVAALILGVVTGNVSGVSHRSAAVSTFMVKRVLKLAVILLGAGVDTRLVAQINLSLIASIGVVVIIALTVTSLVARLLGLPHGTSILIAVGTAICGASAIAAVAPIVKARNDDVVLALGTIFLFNALALMLLPAVALVFGMDPFVFGAWAGMAVHDTAAAVATGFAYTTESGEVATVVKLARTLFLIPLVLILAMKTSLSDIDPSAASRWRLAVKSFPLFVLGFVATASANTLGLLGEAGATIADVGRWLIVGVVVAIGLTLHVTKIGGVGRALMTTGLIAAVTVASVSVALITAFR